MGALVGLEAAEVGHGGVEVDELGDALGGLAVGLAVRVADDEGHAGGILVQRAFLPEAVFAEVVAVVADEDDDGVLVEALLLELREHQPELGVHEGHRRQVGLLGRTLGVLGHAIVGDGGVRKGDRGLRGAVGGGVGDELDLILRVVLEVLLRGDVRRVRAEEAYGQEERLGALLLQEGDGLRGDLAVGLFGVRPLGGEPAQRAAVVACADEDLAGLALGLAGRRRRGDADGEDLILIVAVTAARIPDLFPRLRVVEAVGTDLLRHAVVVELADATDRVAVVLEHLRQRHHVRDHLAEFLRVIVHAGRVGAQAGQEGRAARVAEGILAIGAIEADPFAGERVDVRRQRRTAIGAHAGAAVIRDEQQDVLTRLGRQAAEAQEEQKGGGEAHGTT